MKMINGHFQTIESKIINLLIICHNLIEIKYPSIAKNSHGKTTLSIKFSKLSKSKFKIRVTKYLIAMLLPKEGEYYLPNKEVCTDQ